MGGRIEFKGYIELMQERALRNGVLLSEGGNVFKGKTASIALEDIEPTLNAYFAELKKIFPKKAAIFNLSHFHTLGSVGKKPRSGDIDLGVDVKSILDKEISDKSFQDWNLDPKAVHAEFESLKKRARTSTDEQVMLKAFLKQLTLYINKHAPILYCDETKVTAGNIFGVYPQLTPDGKKVGIGVQIDWMMGDLNWLKFSYHSAAYPVNSNVKGLHRTQLMLAAFQQAGLSFNHVSGVKDKETGKVVATDPKQALNQLAFKLGVRVTSADAEDYYKLHALLKAKCKPEDYSGILDTYFRILDSTRCDIPDDLQDEWKRRKTRLHLTGKFLPDDSALKKEV